MKLTEKLCREAGIINSYDYSYGGKEPFLYYRPQITGRAYQCAAWVIHQKGKSWSTHWRDYGDMVFNVFRRQEKQPQFDVAIDWMKREFGFAEIIKAPLGSYMERGFVEKRNKEIEDALKRGISLREK